MRMLRFFVFYNTDVFPWTKLVASSNGQFLTYYIGELFRSGILAAASDSFLLEYLFALAANKITPSPIKTPITIPYVNGASAIR